ncbi:hypothetical protein N0V88_005194 [Collariella sp. IMI 366227]|nr:hypothetical protein N0V88_005194 [Collariella sp. IMI 366227]
MSTRNTSGIVESGNPTPLPEETEFNDGTNYAPEFNQGDPGAYERDEAPELIENWKPTFDAIVAATRKAFDSSPKGTKGMEPGRGEFLEHWRGVFARLTYKIAADSKFSEHLTSPPTKKFIIKFYDKPSGLCCPCSLPEAWPSITLENEHGVTKLDLINRMGDFLFGGTAPKIYYEVEKKAGSLTMEMPLTYHTDWLSGSIESDV